MGSKIIEHKIKPEKSCLIHAKAEPDNTFVPGTHNRMSSRDHHNEAEEAALSIEKSEAVGGGCRETWVVRGT